MHAKYKDNLLLTTNTLWVINGDWQLEKIDGVFVHPLTKGFIDLHLVGYIDYDGDYNRTLLRFQDGEGTHLPEENELVTPVNEFCKKTYYGIECSCSKCKG